jgi:hypothetical protein
MLQLFIEIFSLFIALLTGIFAYRYLNAFFRLLFWQLIAWIAFYTLGYVVTIAQTLQGKPADNQWLMNIHLLVESGLLLAAARVSFSGKRLKTAALIVFGLVLAVFTFLSFRQGITVYFHHADVAVCIIVTVFYLGLLFHFNFRPPGKGGYFPEKLASTGILAYFACSVPYVAFMGYLQRHDPGLNSVLYHLINDVLANLRYLSLAFAFWSAGRQAVPQNGKS